jgi:hypothetical protein
MSDSKKKKFKFNWGWGLLLFYTFFCVVTVWFVFFTTHQDEDLVTEHYYKKTLTYQQHIDEHKRALKLNNPVTWQIDNTNSNITFEYPASSVKGQIHFYRPSDAKQDKVVTIKPDGNSKQMISLHSFERGLWEIKVNWEENGKTYYQEARLVLEHNS